jgi:Amt family ammonium transporter
MITATALVLLMTLPGLALFYAGMVRKKNVLATLMQVFATAGVVSLVWMVVGYSLALTDGGPYLGDLSRLMLAGWASTAGRSASRPRAPGRRSSRTSSPNPCS